MVLAVVLASILSVQQPITLSGDDLSQAAGIALRGIPFDSLCANNAACRTIWISPAVRRVPQPGVRFEPRTSQIVGRLVERLGPLVRGAAVLMVEPDFGTQQRATIVYLAVVSGTREVVAREGHVSFTANVIQPDRVGWIVDIELRQDGSRWRVNRRRVQAD